MRKRVSPSLSKRTVNRFRTILLGSALLLQSPPIRGDAVPAPETSLTGITQTLIDLLERQDRTTIDPEDYKSTSLGQVIKFGTPAGYRIKLRYLEFGMSLVEALKVSRDEEMKRRLIETVQWARNPRVRAEAIITLAGFSDPRHKKLLKSAILDGKVGIRFAGVEALQRWNQPEAMDLLKLAMTRDWSPFMQIYAAQALLSLGDRDAIQILWKYLDHDSWLVRAMAARYLGDFGDPTDYDKLILRLGKETKNNFVTAELAIAALKLISKKGDKVYYSSASPGWRKNEEVRYTIGDDQVIEPEPLIIVPPRLRIPRSLRIAAQINTQLLRIIKDELDKPLDPVQAQDPVLQDLYGLVTPSGFALQTRYAQLSYLVIEGLAGSQDLGLRAQIEDLARTSTNPLVRATALVSLSYNRDPRDLSLIQEAFRDKNALVRMGALESVEIGRFREALPQVAEVANGDSCPALQAYGMNLLAKFGDPSGRNLLINMINNPDWPARAMGYWYLGRYGTDADYTLVVSRLPNETNPFVKAEIALAALRLEPL